jgi:hypothetical protein
MATILSYAINGFSPIFTVANECAFLMEGAG